MKTILATLVIAAGVSTLSAQPHLDGGQQQQQQQPQGQPPPPPPPDGRRPPPPVIAVLDANHDGVISADEIANASEALKQLDKNGDGQLTPDEMRPPPPPRSGGQNHNDPSQDQNSGRQNE